MTDTVHIAVVANRDFLLPLAALLKSIEVHTPGPICCHIFYEDFTAHQRAQATAALDPRCEAQWHPIGDHYDRHLGELTSDLPRMLCAWLLPPSVLAQVTPRLIVMDADIIAQRDLRALWESDITGVTLGAVRDPVYQRFGGNPDNRAGPPIRNYRELGLAAELPYFNAGVLLVDTQRWQELDVLPRAVTILNGHTRWVMFTEQYALNIVLAGDWRELDGRWNSFAYLGEPDPFLLHFNWCKPWHIKPYLLRRTSGFEIFFAHLRQTPFARWRPLTLQNVAYRLRRLFDKRSRLV